MLPDHMYVRLTWRPCQRTRPRLLQLHLPHHKDLLPDRNHYHPPADCFLRILQNPGNLQVSEDLQVPGDLQVLLFLPHPEAGSH